MESLILFHRFQAGPSRYRYAAPAEPRRAADCPHVARLIAGLGATIFSAFVVATSLAALGAVIVEPLTRLAWVA